GHCIYLASLWPVLVLLQSSDIRPGGLSDTNPRRGPGLRSGTELSWLAPLVAEFPL
ncbi:hypothetical protein SK128_020786, partial [Halocaridina rubra]